MSEVFEGCADNLFLRGTIGMIWVGEPRLGPDTRKLY